MGASYYSIVRYVPDPTAGEQINVGVVAFGGGHVRSRFLRDWSRVKRFGAEDTGFLKDFARTLAVSGSVPSERERWTKDYVQSLAAGWKGSIQLTEPRASLEPIEVVLQEAAQRFLKDGPRRRRVRSRRSAVAAGLREVSHALRLHLGTRPHGLIKRNHVLAGQLDSHAIDIVVGNGIPYFAAEGISFELQDIDALKNDVDTTAWTIDDLRKREDKLPLAILALPPTPENAPALIQYERARRVYQGLGADLIAEEAIGNWAAQMAQTVNP